jgi:hypothetical protein
MMKATEKRNEEDAGLVDTGTATVRTEFRDYFRFADHCPESADSLRTELPRSPFLGNLREAGRMVGVDGPDPLIARYTSTRPSRSQHWLTI